MFLILLFALCCAVRRDWLIDFCFFFSLSSLSALAVRDRCWVLLSVARCVGSRDPVQHSSNTLMDVGSPGSQRRRFYPHQARRGRAERVSVGLWWSTCSGRIVITNCKLLFLFVILLTAALQHPTSWFLRSSFAAYRSASKLASLAQALPLFIHILHAIKKKKKKTLLSVYMWATASALLLEKKEKWSERGSAAEGNEISSWPYLASADNASRRCKWDKWPLSWRLDVARWWFAFKRDCVCGMAVAKQKVLLRERGTWDREEERERERWIVTTSHNALQRRDLWRTEAVVWDCLSGTPAIDRHTGKLIGSDMGSSYCARVCVRVLYLVFLQKRLISTI